WPIAETIGLAALRAIFAGAHPPRRRRAGVARHDLARRAHACQSLLVEQAVAIVVERRDATFVLREHLVLAAADRVAQRVALLGAAMADAVVLGAGLPRIAGHLDLEQVNRLRPIADIERAGIAVVRRVGRSERRPGSAGAVALNLGAVAGGLHRKRR